MAWTWNPWAVPGFAAGALAFLLAFAVFRARPRDALNRATAAAVAAAGSGSFFTSAVRLSTTDPADALAAWLTGIPFAGIALGALPLIFRALPSPLTPIVAGRAAIAAGALYAASAITIVLWRPALFVAGVRWQPAVGAYSSQSEPLYQAYQFVALAVLLLGAMHAGLAMRRAGGDATRRRTRALALGLGLALAIHVLGIGAVNVLGRGLGEGAPASVVVVNYLYGPIATLVLVGFLSYGILTAQMFDIDLRLKRGVAQSALAAGFVGVFFVVSEAAQTILSAQLGSVAGLLAAGLLVFAIAPLQRAAERVSDAAMPRVHDTAEYRLVRKREVYRAAYESARIDGEVTEKERTMLATLASELGLTPRDALDIEREARG